MVPPEGFLDPEANAVRYRARRQILEWKGNEMSKDESVPVMGIRLRKDGKHTVVDAEVGGAWIEVIRELSDGEFCHIVEPSGIMSCYYAAPT